MNILSLSYGKDSIACLEAITRLGLPLDEVIHSELMATDTIPADLPHMMEFKDKADKIIKDRYGIEVKRIKGKFTYEEIFYRKRVRGINKGKIYGFPCTLGSWCIDKYKTPNLKVNPDDITYLGIAVDEAERIERHQKPNIRLPLVEIGWTEQDCYDWCKENDLLSPIYESSFRGGCWFCHKQGVAQLRLLRKNYPLYWQMLLEWDKDSPYIFKITHTVADYDKRFEMEDRGLIPKDNTFKWKSVETKQLSIFDV